MGIVCRAKKKIVIRREKLNGLSHAAPRKILQSLCLDIDVSSALGLFSSDSRTSRSTFNVTAESTSRLWVLYMTLDKTRLDILPCVSVISGSSLSGVKKFSHTAVKTQSLLPL